MKMNYFNNILFLNKGIILKWKIKMQLLFRKKKNPNISDSQAYYCCF